MRPRTVVLAGLLGLAPLCGCQSLSGTHWVASEIKVKSASDSARAAEVRALLVEFGRDGSLRTTVQRADGSLRTEQDESYEVLGNTILIKHPGYQKSVVFQLRDNMLFVQSDEYDLTFVRHVPTPTPAAVQRPAMFRAAEMRQPEYRRVSYVRR